MRSPGFQLAWHSSHKPTLLLCFKTFKLEFRTLSRLAEQQEVANQCSCYISIFGDYFIFTNTINKFSKLSSPVLHCGIILLHLPSSCCQSWIWCSHWVTLLGKINNMTDTWSNFFPTALYVWLIKCRDEMIYYRFSFWRGNMNPHQSMCPYSPLHFPRVSPWKRGIDFLVMFHLGKKKLYQ